MGLYRYNLGVDPKEEAEEKNLVSPFMKLEVDEPKKVHVELDLDEGNLSRGMVIIEWFGISEFSRTMRRDLLNNVLRLWAGIFLLNI